MGHDVWESMIVKTHSTIPVIEFAKEFRFLHHCHRFGFRIYCPTNIMYLIGRVTCESCRNLTLVQQTGMPGIAMTSRWPGLMKDTSK